MAKVEIFGIKFDNLTMEEAIKEVRGFVVLPYSEFIVRAQKDKEFKSILNSADFCLCEGRGLYFASKFMGKLLNGNINGVDLIYNICSKAQNPKFPARGGSASGGKFQKVFLYGSHEDTVKKTAEKLGECVIGYEHGYQDADKVINKINLVKSDVLLVGLGSPKQEKFIAENLKKMPSVKLAIGVGGAFDFISGHIKRAPTFFQKAGLEWLWRFILGQKKMSRVFSGVFGLGFLVIKEKFFR